MPNPVVADHDIGEEGDWHGTPAASVPALPGTAEDDIIVIFFQGTTAFGPAPMTDDAGFTELAYSQSGDSGSGGDVVSWAMARLAGTDSSYDFAWGAELGSVVGWTILRVTGGGMPSPTPDASADAATTGTSVTAPSVAPEDPDALLLYAGGARGPATRTITVPTDMTSVVTHHVVNSFSSSNGIRQRVARQDLTASGATGTRTGTANASDRWGALMVAVPATSEPIEPETSLYRGKLDNVGTIGDGPISLKFNLRLQP